MTGDLNTLNEYWNESTRNLNEKIDDAFRDAQDYAYQLGVKRGLKDAARIADDWYEKYVDTDDAPLTVGAAILEAIA